MQMTRDLRATWRRESEGWRVNMVEIAANCRQLISERVLAREKHPVFSRVAAVSRRTTKKTTSNTKKKNSKSKEDLFAHLRMVLRSSMDIASALVRKDDFTSLGLEPMWDIFDALRRSVRWIVCGIVCEARGLMTIWCTRQERRLNDEDEVTLAQFQRDGGTPNAFD